MIGTEESIPKGVFGWGDGKWEEKIEVICVFGWEGGWDFWWDLGVFSLGPLFGVILESPWIGEKMGREWGLDENLPICPYPPLLGVGSFFSFSNWRSFLFAYKQLFIYVIGAWE